jgi:acyl dehydratase
LGAPDSACSEEVFMPPLIIENMSSLKNFVGKEIGLTGWFRVTQDRIQQFAEATEDRQWIHLDPERARKESPYGTTIAHGFLTLSLISHLLKQAIEIRAGVRLAINYGLNRVRFPSPVRAGANVRARFVLLALKEQGNALEAVYSVSIESEGAEKPSCVAEWIVRYYS